MKLHFILSLILVPTIFAKRRPVNTKFVTPTAHLRSDRVYFEAHFDSHKELFSRWTTSFGRKQVNATHSEEYDGVWAIELPGKGELENDLALLMKSKAHHHAISSRFPRRFRWTNVSDLVIQYEAAFDEAVECGGAYAKLLTYSTNLDLHQFNDRTPYAVMFGPDKCDNHYKIHFILRIPPCAAALSPVRGHSELFFDQSMMYADRSRTSVYKQLETLFTDRKFHLYTLVIRQSGAERAFEIYIDQQQFYSAPMSALKATNISDPQYADASYCPPAPSAPAASPSPSSTPSTSSSSTTATPTTNIALEVCEKPGSACSAPAEKKPRVTFGLSESFYIGAVGLELFSLSPNIGFDNFIVTDQRVIADQYARQTWLQKQMVAEYRSDFYSKFVYETILEVTADMPWLWAVLLVFIVLPLLLLAYYFCCIRPQKILEERRIENDNDNDYDVDGEMNDADADETNDVDANGCDSNHEHRSTSRSNHARGAACGHDHDHRQQPSTILKNAANASLVRRRVRFADESPMRSTPFNEFDQEYAVHDSDEGFQTGT